MTTATKKKSTGLRRGPAQIFIGSSSEAIRIAEAINDGLAASRVEGKPTCAPRIWDNVFASGDYVIERLAIEAPGFDYAIMVITPDDVQVSRNSESLSPRDNINLEIGFFLATLGRAHTIVLRPSNIPVKLPSDLLGIQNVFYEFRGYDVKPEDIRSSINQIRNHIEDNGLREMHEHFFSSWGYAAAARKFGAYFDPQRLRRWGNGRHFLLLVAFLGEKSDAYITNKIALSELWPIPRQIPGEVLLEVDCSKICHDIRDGETVWGVLFLLDHEADLSCVERLDDLLILGGRQLDGRGNVYKIDDATQFPEEAESQDENRK